MWTTNDTSTPPSPQDRDFKLAARLAFTLKHPARLLAIVQRASAGGKGVGQQQVRGEGARAWGSSRCGEWGEGYFIRVAPVPPYYLLLCFFFAFNPVFRIRIRMDPHKDMPLGSGSAWTDSDPDPGGKKSLENVQVH